MESESLILEIMPQLLDATCTESVSRFIKNSVESMNQWGQSIRINRIRVFDLPWAKAKCLKV
jgi:hypothetical protein